MESTVKFTLSHVSIENYSHFLLNSSCVLPKNPHFKSLERQKKREETVKKQGKVEQTMRKTGEIFHIVSVRDGFKNA